jgi:hypothetical protein
MRNDTFFQIETEASTLTSLWPALPWPSDMKQLQTRYSFFDELMRTEPTPRGILNRGTSKDTAIAYLRGRMPMNNADVSNWYAQTDWNKASSLLSCVLIECGEILRQASASLWRLHPINPRSCAALHEPVHTQVAYAPSKSAPSVATIAANPTWDVADIASQQWLQKNQQGQGLPP